jgi:peptidoglycan/LPS O-acetylase OafA/YrhL
VTAQLIRPWRAEGDVELIRSLVASPRIAGLDGLRACAVLIVLVAHFGFSQIVPGGFGVTLFFFISGVLITRLLMAEYAKTGGVQVLNFYVRRFLRLYPALLLSVAGSVILYPLFNGHVPWADVPAVLFYYANYYGGTVGFMQGGMPDYGVFQTFGILWSLAVEEQYYLVFPLLMVWLLVDLRKAQYFFAVVIVACLLWRIWLHLNGHGDRIYGSTDTRIDSILYGAWLATALARAGAVRLVSVLSHPALFAAGIVGILVSLLCRDEWFRDTLRYSVQGLSLIPIVTAICFSGRYRVLTSLMDSRLMAWIGALSYSLYLFHGHAIVIGENLFHVRYVDPVSQLPAAYFFLTISLTLLFATGSYYLVEKPLFSLRVRFGSHVGH